MLVKLARDWFAPDAGRRRVRDNPHTLPDEWKAQLPPGAIIIPDDEPVAPIKKGKGKQAELDL